MSDARALRDAFGAFMTGVTVVTTLGPDGEPRGFTANSFASVSLDPPLLLVCIARSSRNYGTFTAATRFAVNVLADAQKEVANAFARPSADRFAAVSWSSDATAAPVFDESAAWFDCSTHQVVEAGDHAILIGRVESFAQSGRNGLGYARGGYFTASLEHRTHGESFAAAVAERGGDILLIANQAGRYHLPGCEIGEASAPAALAAALQRETGLHATIGFLFSVFDDRATRRSHAVYRAEMGPGEPTQGRFFALENLPIDRLDTPQTADILRRFAAERTLGDFRIYFGDESRGRVHPLSQVGRLTR